MQNPGLILMKETTKSLVSTAKRGQLIWYTLQL